MAHRSRAASLRRTSQSAAASRARSVPSASSCRTVVRSRMTFFIGHCRSTRTPCLKDRHGESKIQRTYRRSTPKAHRKKTCRARPWPRICSALKNRHPRSGPSRRLSRSTRACIRDVAQRFRRSLSIDENSLFEGSSRRVENPTDLPSVDAKGPQEADLQSSALAPYLQRVEESASTEWSESTVEPKH